MKAFLEGRLGCDLTQVSGQQDLADLAVINRGLNLTAIETEGSDAFASQAALDEALIQCAPYANWHRTPVVWAFDGRRLVLASRDQQADAINVHIETRVDVPEPPDELFYFTHYGLFRYPTAVLRSIPYSAADDQALYTCCRQVATVVRRQAGSVFRMPPRRCVP